MSDSVHVPPGSPNGGSVDESPKLSARIIGAGAVKVIPSTSILNAIKRRSVEEKPIVRASERRLSKT